MASSSSSKPMVDVDITIVSAKQLKNVNWRHGDLKPYAVLYLAGLYDHDDVDSRRLATKPDDAGSTRPVWNERFTLPVPSSLLDRSTLALEIFHSKPSETPKPLVGTVRCSLKDLISSPDPTPIRTLELRRPSGRPQGKVRIKISAQERAPPPPPPPPPQVPVPSSPPPTDHHHVRPSSWYYYSKGPPPPPSPAVASSSVRDSRSYSPPPAYFSSIPPPPPYQYGNYSDPYPGYYSSTGYYSAPARMTMPPPSYYDHRPSSGYGGPSAPVDYSSGHSYSHQQRDRGSRMGGMGAGLAVGAMAGALGGLALDEGLNRGEEKIAERVESDYLFRDDFRDFRDDY